MSEGVDRLASTEDSDILTNALAFYRRNKHLTPKLAFVVLWRLRHHRIDHNPSFFKVSLKKTQYKEDLRRMDVNRAHTIGLPCLLLNGDRW